MRPLRARLILIAAGLAACATPPAAPDAVPAVAEPVEPPAPPDPGPDGIFAWLDGLELPSPRGRPTGFLVTKWSREAAFLLPEADGTARVLTLALDVRPLGGDLDGARFVPAPLADVVAETLEPLAEDRSRQQRWQRHMAAFEGMGVAGRLTVLAWGAAGRGDEASVATLLAKASEYRDAGTPFEPKPEDMPTLAAAVREQAETALYRIAIDGGWTDPRPSWERRRERLTAFLRHFPESTRAATAREGIAHLTRMIDERDRIVPVEALSDLHGDALVDALALRLRLARAGFGSAMGGPGSALGARWNLPETDADRLVALGRPAVPRLLTHLADPEWTEITYEGRGYGDPHVLPVGGVVREVLTEITGQWFSSQADGEKWLADVTSRGEPALLADAIRARNYDVRHEATRLVALDPKLALAALLDRLAKWKERGLVLGTLGALGTIDDPAAVAALRAAMAGDDLQIGLTAARLLRPRDAAATNAWLLAHWRALRTIPKVSYPARPEDVDTAESIHEAVEGIASDLGEHCGDAGIAALCDDFAARPVVMRLRAIEVLVARAPDPFAGPVGAVLAAALDDRTPTALGIDANESQMLRACDTAAAAVAKRDSRFPFIAEAAEHERDARIVRVRNRLRAVAGEPAAPEAALPSAPRADESALPLLYALRTAADREAAAAAAHALEDVGLGALPLLRESVAALPADATRARAALTRTERRIACVVREVVVGPDVDAAIADALRSAAGKVLDPDALASMVRAGVDRDRRHGLEVRIHRPGDDTGVVIDVRPSPGAPSGCTLEGVASGGFDRDSERGLAMWRDDTAELLSRPSRDAIASRARIGR